MRETESQARAKKALHGFQSLRRLELRAAKAPSPYHAVVARHEAAAAYAETTQMLEPIGEVVHGAGEMTTRPQSEWLDPTRAAILETLGQPHTVAIGASEQRMEAIQAAGVMVSALDAAVAAGAKNSVEKMLAHQSAAAHHMAMKMMARALETHHQPADVARLLNAAARLMIAGQGAVLTLQKIRTGGKQTVVVQHVRVSDGGQAVIAGNMNAETRGVVEGRGSNKCKVNPAISGADGSRTATGPETSLQLHDAARGTGAARPASAPPCGMVGADSTAASAPARKRPKESSESDERA